MSCRLLVCVQRSCRRRNSGTARVSWSWCVESECEYSSPPVNGTAEYNKWCFQIIIFVHVWSSSEFISHTGPIQLRSALFDSSCSFINWEWSRWLLCAQGWWPLAYHRYEERGDHLWHWSTPTSKALMRPASSACEILCFFRIFISYKFSHSWSSVPGKTTVS